MTPPESVPLQLKALSLPSAARAYPDLLARARCDDWSLEAFAAELLGAELEGRRQHRIARLVQEAHLPPGKTLASLELDRLPLRIRRLLPGLCAGDFADRADNLLIFGLPGRGKTHLAAAIGHALVQQGRRVFFSPAFALVDRLLRAKRDLELERVLRRLDRFAVVILDDLGYVQQSRTEMEVLFTFLAERYERRSVVLTSNLVFSEWDRLFQDPLTTAAAIDRLVHHCVIWEFGADVPSVRAEAAARRQRETPAAAPDPRPAPAHPAGSPAPEDSADDAPAHPVASRWPNDSRPHLWRRLPPGRPPPLLFGLVSPGRLVPAPPDPAPAGACPDPARGHDLRVPRVRRPVPGRATLRRLPPILPPRRTGRALSPLQRASGRGGSPPGVGR